MPYHPSIRRPRRIAALCSFSLLLASLLAVAEDSHAAAAGRYRAIVTGFSVKSQTWDHALEVDGKGDEVYVASSTMRVNRDGQASYGGDRTSETMGDTNGQPGRVQAGTAPCCWPWFDTTYGGLRTNDKFPTATPWLLSAQPSPQRNYPPMTVWEGELVKGGDGVIVAPTLWEWDGGKDVYGDWVKWGQQTIGKIGPVLGTLFGPDAVPFITATKLGLDVAVSLSESGIVGQASDRPIGFDKVDGKGKFDPKLLALTYETAERAVHENVSGLGNGVVELRYKDHDDWRGDYSLYVKVEKLQDTSTVDVVAPKEPTPLPAEGCAARRGLTPARYQQEFAVFLGRGCRLIDVDGYEIGGSERLAAVWAKEPGPAWQARHGLTRAEFEATAASLRAGGYRPVVVEAYTAGGQERYAAVFQRDAVPAVELYGLTAAGYQAQFNALVAKGYRLVHVSGHGSGDATRYAAVFARTGGPAWTARHGLSAAEYQSTVTSLMADGYRPTMVDAYGTGDGIRFAAIFERDGLGWVARHGLTADQFDAEDSQWVAKGMHPRALTGYTVQGAERYAAVWSRPPSGVGAIVRAAFDVRDRLTQIQRVKVLRLHARTRISWCIERSRGRCRTQKMTVRRKRASVTLKGLAGRQLAPNATLNLRVTRPGTVGLEVRYVARNGRPPARTSRSLAVGTA